MWYNGSNRLLSTECKMSENTNKIALNAQFNLKALTNIYTQLYTADFIVCIFQCQLF